MTTMQLILLRLELYWGCLVYSDKAWKELCLRYVERTGEWPT